MRHNIIFFLFDYVLAFHRPFEIEKNPTIFYINLTLDVANFYNVYIMSIIVLYNQEINYNLIIKIINNKNQFLTL